MCSTWAYSFSFKLQHFTAWFTFSCFRLFERGVSWQRDDCTAAEREPHILEFAHRVQLHAICGFQEAVEIASVVPVGRVFLQPVPLFSTCPHVQCRAPRCRPKRAGNQSVHATIFRCDDLPVWNCRLHYVCKCHKRILGEFLELFCDEWTSDRCKPMPSRVLQLQRIFNVPITTSSSIRLERKFAVCRQPYWNVVWRLPPQLHSVHRR